ncbi:hypothetical protein [Asticcacaulis solisilvae]|uniref:hypothetical protein n=1 Tax=Asticcacaulis solisilvae TaxID=1217274 RepID=UPI003FD7B2A9
MYSNKAKLLLSVAFSVVCFAPNVSIAQVRVLPKTAEVLRMNTNAAGPQRQGGFFVYSDGTQVRASDPSGHDGKVNPDHSISFSDGTRVSHDTKTGVTIVDHPDGTRTVTDPNTPKATPDGNITWSDGYRVRGSDPNGNAGHVNGDGSVSYADGTRVSHDVNSGETKIVGADGTVTVTDKTSPALGGGAYTYSDGYRVPSSDPNGEAGHLNRDNSITYADGTRVSHDPVSTDTKIFHPDGTVTVLPGGTGGGHTSGATGVDGDGNLMWSDGFGVPAHDPNGGAGHEIGNGWIGYPDGTMVSHDTNSGDTKIVHPDGSVTFNNARTGEHSETSAGQNGKPAANNNNNANTNTNNNNNNNNGGNTDKTKDKPASDSDKPDKGEKPDKGDKPDKGGKGLVVNDDGPGGNGGTASSTGLYNPWGGRAGGSAGHVTKPGGLDDSPTKGSQPTSPPKQIARGAGPGGRPFNQSNARQGNGPRVQINPGSLVINPDPNALAGGGGARVIDPYGGRR